MGFSLSAPFVQRPSAAPASTRMATCPVLVSTMGNDRPSSRISTSRRLMWRIMSRASMVGIDSNKGVEPVGTSALWTSPRHPPRKIGILQT